MLFAFIELLRSIAPPLAAPGHISRLRPSATSHLPALVVSGRNLDRRTPGIGSTSTLRSEENHRQETTCVVWSGLLVLEVWVTDQASADFMEQILAAFLHGHPDQVRQYGFEQLTLHAVSVQERRRLGNHGRAVRFSHTYQAIYEEQHEQTIGPGGIITSIPVRLEADGQQEPFTIDENTG